MEWTGKDSAAASGSGARLIADVSGSCAPRPRTMEALLGLLAMLLLGCVAALSGEELPATGKASMSVYQDLQPGAGARPCYSVPRLSPHRKLPSKRCGELLLSQRGARATSGGGVGAAGSHPLPQRLGWLVLHSHKACEGAVKRSRVE